MEKLKLVMLGSDAASKYEADYAAERTRYLEVLRKIIAYKLSDGSDLNLGMVNFSGLEHQAEQVDTRPGRHSCSPGGGSWMIPVSLVIT